MKSTWSVTKKVRASFPVFSNSIHGTPDCPSQNQEVVLDPSPLTFESKEISNSLSKFYLQNAAEVQPLSIFPTAIARVWATIISHLDCCTPLNLFKTQVWYVTLLHNTFQWLSIALRIMKQNKTHILTLPARLCITWSLPNFPVLCLGS